MVPKHTPNKSKELTEKLSFYETNNLGKHRQVAWEVRSTWSQYINKRYNIISRVFIIKRRTEARLF